MLLSRNLTTTEFSDDFYATILPGVIPRNEFIKWPAIDSLIDEYALDLEQLQQAAADSRLSTKEKLSKFLVSSEDPLSSMRFLFRLLGHTNDVYVCLEERIDIKAEAINMAAGSVLRANAMEIITTSLIEMGIDKILDKNLKEVLLGVCVGLETHRRKNGGGTAFKDLIGDFLEEVLPLLRKKHPTIELKPEVQIVYSNGRQSKNVDFAYLINSKPVIGFEVNFYTSTGSKPTEIKRSYAQVRRDLEEVGTQLVWVTDGEGYMKMKKSLADAQETHPNIYNYSMLKKYVLSDILEYLKTEEI